MHTVQIQEIVINNALIQWAKKFAKFPSASQRAIPRIDDLLAHTPVNPIIPTQESDRVLLDIHDGIYARIG